MKMVRALNEIDSLTNENGWSIISIVIWNFAMTRTSNWKEIYRELRLVECSEEASAKITSEHLSREAKQKYRVDSDG